MGILPTLFAVFRSAFRSRVALELENFALRHQLNVLKRSVPRPRLTPADRYLWVVLSRVWQNWRAALAIIRPETVIAWHRQGFRLFWTWKVRCGKPGRPAAPREVRDLFRQMSRDNPLWARPTSMVSCSNWASPSARPVWPNTWSGNADRHRRLGAPS